MKTTRGILAILALLAVLAAGAQAQTTAFTYQGQITNAGVPPTGNYDLKFELFDAATGGTLLGTVTQTVPVTSGLFTATLDFGSVFPGANRWLSIRVRPSGVGNFTVLTPREPITPSPYAIGLELPFAGTANLTSNAFSVTNNNTGAAVAGTSTGDISAGVVGTSTGPDGTGVSGIADNGINAYGVHGESNAYGVYGESSQGVGVYGYSDTGTALSGDSTDGIGVQGGSGGNEGVIGTSHDAAGVYGINFSGIDLYSAGVVGEGRATNGNGVSGIADAGTDAFGIYGEATGGGYAGCFQGNVYVSGTLSKAGGSFKIDDPLDPANKYLYHSFVESPDMKDVYDGVATTGADGRATVELPAYFETLNRDFRYQLTVIGQFAQAIVETKIANNAFVIRTDKPAVEVSWQVTGIRQDPWANANRIPVEQEKTGAERGLYLHPELYGKPAAMSILAAKAPAGGSKRPAPLHEPPAKKAPMTPPAPAAPGASR